MGLSPESTVVLDIVDLLEDVDNVRDIGVVSAFAFTKHFYHRLTTLSL